MLPYRRPWRTFWEASLVEDIKHLRWMGRMVSLFGHHLRKQRQCLVISGDRKRTLYLALLTWTEPRNWLSRVVALGTAELRLSQEPTDKEESATYLSGVLRLRGTTGSIDLAFAHRRSCLLFLFPAEVQLSSHSDAVQKIPFVMFSSSLHKLTPLILTCQLEFRNQLSPCVLCPCCSNLVQSHLSSQIRLLGTKGKLNPEVSFKPCRHPKIPRWRQSPLCGTLNRLSADHCTLNCLFTVPRASEQNWDWGTSCKMDFMRLPNTQTTFLWHTSFSVLQVWG